MLATITGTFRFFYFIAPCEFQSVLSTPSFLLQIDIMTLDPRQAFKGWSSGPPGIIHRIDLDMELRLALCGVVFVALMVTGEWNILIKFTLVFSYRYIDLRCYW